MSVGSKDRVETNGQTDRRTDRQTKGNDYITFPTNMVGKDLDFCTKINVFLSLEFKAVIVPATF